jgi:26S proteasome regulatory subunit N6
MATSLFDQFQAARELASVSPEGAVVQARGILLTPSSNADSQGVKEKALALICEVLVRQQDAQGLRTLLTDLQPQFVAMPKAKSAKMVRTVIDNIGKIPNSTDLLVSLLTRPQVPNTMHMHDVVSLFMVEAALDSLPSGPLIP